MLTNGYIVLTVFFKQDEDVWTAKCQELGTATFGDTFEEAKLNIEEAIKVHLSTLEDVGEIDRFFRENNIKIYSHRPSRIKVDAPFDSDTYVTQKTEQIFACA